MSDGYLREAVREIRRCRKNIEAGGNPAFWIARLRAAAIEHEQAAEHLRREELVVADIIAAEWRAKR